MSGRTVGKQVLRWGVRVAIATAVVSALALLSALSARAADDPNETCLACHSDKTLTTKHGGRTVALFVEGKKFKSSVHGSLACTNCHADLEGAEFPHPTPKKVTCGTCHSQEQEL